MGISEELEWAIDIVDLVWRYTKLKKAGANYKATCPFPWHNEKTPSFIVSPSKQLAYCFGCHRWWGPIKFIMDIENYEFREAIEVLWNITWIKVKSYNKEEDLIAKNLYWLYKDAVNFYANNIEKYDKIKSYISERWLNEESIKTFKIWYSDSWIELYNYLKSKWYDDNIISDSNIFLDIKSKKDKFLNRVIFPIQNNRWDYVALAWRIVWKWEPKYLNSPASKIYDKSSILYWLYQARTSITKKDFIIITEWYMDTISLHQAWFTNTVAVSGTALTEKHIPIIKRLTKKIYLCFDNDKAWIDATKLSIDMLKNKDVEVKVINMVWAKDPDEIIKSWKDFQTFIDSALTPIWFIIEKVRNKYDFNSIEEKKKLLTLLLNIIKSYSNTIEVDFYLKEVSNLLDIKEDIIYQEYNRVRLKRENTAKTVIKNNITSEDILIWYILNDESFIPEIKEKILFKNNISNYLKDILEKWISIVDSFDIDISQRLKAMAAKQEEINSHENKEKINIDMNKVIHKLNIDLYKKEEAILKEKMNKWDTDAFVEYNNLIKIAKENKLKR